MTTSLAPRTCTRCGRDYTVKPGQAKYNRHMFGVCQRCKDPRADAYSRHSDYSHVKPIADEDDDTRPVWQYRTPTGVVILLPDDLGAMTKRLSHYFTNRFGKRAEVVFDLDDDMRITGSGMLIGPETRHVYARFHVERIQTSVAA